MHISITGLNDFFWLRFFFCPKLAQSLHVDLKRKKSAKKVSEVGCAQLLVKYVKY